MDSITKSNSIEESLQTLIHAAETKKDVSGHRRKFITSVSVKEEYGVELLKVKDIMGFMHINTVSQTLNYTKGSVKLLGKIKP